MNIVVTSLDAAAPASNYAPAVAVPAGARHLHISGQVGVTPDGTLVAGIEGQIEAAFDNIFALLAEAGMALTDLYELTVIIADPADVPAYRGTRDRCLQGHVCCSTLLVCGLASPDWRVEIAARAARLD